MKQKSLFDGHLLCMFDSMCACTGIYVCCFVKTLHYCPVAQTEVD